MTGRGSYRSMSARPVLFVKVDGSRWGEIYPAMTGHLLLARTGGHAMSRPAPRRSHGSAAGKPNRCRHRLAGWSHDRRRTADALGAAPDSRPAGAAARRRVVARRPADGRRMVVPAGGPRPPA